MAEQSDQENEASKKQENSFNLDSRFALKANKLG